PTRRAMHPCHALSLWTGRRRPAARVRRRKVRDPSQNPLEQIAKRRLERLDFLAQRAKNVHRATAAISATEVRDMRQPCRLRPNLRFDPIPVDLQVIRDVPRITLERRRLAHILAHLVPNLLRALRNNRTHALLHLIRDARKINRESTQLGSINRDGHTTTSATLNRADVFHVLSSSTLMRTLRPTKRGFTDSIHSTTSSPRIAVVPCGK